MHVLFTHNDLDGVGCGILAKCAFGDEADVRYHSVSSLNPAIESFLEKRHDTKYVFITDLAVDEENERTLQAWFQEGGKVQLIDHHKSALHLDQQKWAQVTVSYEDGRLTSATSLFYDHLIKKNLLIENEALKEFVELVRQYDTWEWEKNENDKAKQLNDLLYLTSIEDFTDSMIHRLQTEPGFAFTAFEEKLLALEDEKIQRYLRKKKRELAQIHVQEHCVGVVHAESYHSELGNILGKEHPHMDYIAILNMGGKRVGFRTIHDHVDVSQVAHTFGGGGHAKAAGCSLTEEAYHTYVTTAFQVEPLRADSEENVYNIKESKEGTLYESVKGDYYYVFPIEESWCIRHEKSRTTVKTFAEAERFLKRHHACRLVEDERFVLFLQQEARE